MYIPDEISENNEIVKRYRNLLRTWYTRKTVEDKKIVRKAFNLAVEAHKGVRRKSGEPYIYHPLEVARIAAGEIGLGTTSIVCALIHDVVEDTNYTLNDIRNLFGDKVARIIDGLTKIEEIFDEQTASLQAENFKKMLLTLSDDVRVILIKLADRLHNMRTLDSIPRLKQLKIASETNYLYAPLAHRLGLFSIKSELEDLALKYLEPEIFSSISEKLTLTKSHRTKFVRKFLASLRKALNKQNVKFRIQAKEKSINSIWGKMKQNEIPFEDIFDSFSIQFIIDAEDDQEKIDCWKVYSIITSQYRPNMDRLKDWVSIPKANGYEALHTTVMSHAGQWVEVQIQTERMKDIAEKGYAAHWKYRSDENESGLDEWLSRIREILKGDEENALDFLSDFKMNLFSDEIYLFTPRGELKTLPKGATVLDFAYHIHSQIGDNCIGANVNLKLVPLSYRLKNGDQVDILTSGSQKPKDEWLNLVVTARAKSRIKHSIHDYRKTFKDEGKEKLIDYFKKLGLEYSRPKRNYLLEKIGISSPIELYFYVAKSKIGIDEVKQAFIENDKGKWFRNISIPFLKSKSNNAENVSNEIRENIRKKPEDLLLEGSISKLNYRISKCCNPIPGDDVIGMVSQNDIIVIHRTNCPLAIQNMSKFGNRIVKAKWRKKETISFLAGIKLTSIDNVGFINKITAIISNDFKLNIRSFHLETSEGVTNTTIMVYVNDLNSLNNLIDHLKKVKEIKKISRIDRFSEI
jgi:GTP pyrophosphokinase